MDWSRWRQKLKTGECLELRVAPVSQTKELERVPKGKGPDPVSEAGSGTNTELGGEFIGRLSRGRRLCGLLGLR